MPPALLLDMVHSHFQTKSRACRWLSCYDVIITYHNCGTCYYKYINSLRVLKALSSDNTKKTI